MIGPLLAAAVEDAESRGLPLTLIGWDGRARGVFVFEEAWRPGSEGRPSISGRAKSGRCSADR